MKLAAIPITSLEIKREKGFVEKENPIAVRKKRDIENNTNFFGSNLSDMIPTGICITAYDHPYADIRSPVKNGRSPNSASSEGRSVESIVLME